MIIDCDSCDVRGAACGDCVIGVLLGAPEEPGTPVVRLDVSEQRALAVLADQGLVPRLRLVAPPVCRPDETGGSGAQRQVG
jgi:hypothetical protein